MAYKEILQKLFGKPVDIKDVTKVEGEKNLVNIHIEVNGQHKKIRKSTGFESSKPQPNDITSTE